MTSNSVYSTSDMPAASRRAVSAPRSEDDFTGLDELLHDWKVTAGQLEDPFRKRVLLSPGLDQDDFTEAEAPAEPGDK
jgi:hypothetical protein